MEYLLIAILNSRLTLQEFDTKRACMVTALSIKELKGSTRIKCVKLTKTKEADTRF